MDATLRVGAGTRPASDRSLVERARSGDVRAFEDLLDRSLDRAYRTALAILRTDWDARDACQEALVDAWRELPTLRDAERFDAWLDRIVVNRCRTLLRRRRSRVREVVIDDASPAHQVASAERPLGEATAEQEAVRQAFARLSADQASILALHHGEGRPVKEIAALLGIPAGTVMWRLHAARRALEKALREVSA